MYDLVHGGHIQPGTVPCHAAHVAVKRHGRQIVCITAAEKFGNSLLNAVFPDRGESQLSQSTTLVGFAEIQMVQTNGKILIYAVMIRAKGKIANALLPIQEHIIVFSRLADALGIMLCIDLYIIVLPHALRINAGVGFLPNDLPGLSDLERILLGCFFQLNHGAYREWYLQ